MSASFFITHYAATSASSSSHLCNKLYKNLSLEYSLFSIPAHFFPPNPKPKLTLKFKTHFPSFSLHSRSSLLSADSATFDGVQLTQNAQSTESGDDDEEEEDDDEFEEDNGQEDSESENEDEAIEAGRLYVGNLPFAMTSSQLAEIFGEAGHVVNVEIVYDRVTGRSRGFAFVTMGNVQEAKGAIRMFEGSQIGGRAVKVNFPEVPRGGEKEVIAAKVRSGYKGFVDTPHKIYVGNLGWGVTSQELTQVFADQPGLLSAKVIYDRNSGRSRGFGFVTFASAEEAESALSAKNELEVEGRPLRLHFAEQRAPAQPS